MMYLRMSDENVYTIGDIYNKNKTDQTLMLSNYPADFWKPYRDNNTYFDRRFKTLYKSWFPYDQDSDEGLAAVADEFRLDVYAHLMANDKRYSELFRVNSIADNDAYSLVNNVDYTETRQRTEGRDGENVKGSETITDTGANQYGAQTITQDNERVKGSETITEDNDVVNGARSDTTYNSTSAYNESGYTPVDKTEADKGEQTDHEDRERVEGQRTDTEDLSTTLGAHTDNISNTRVDGQRTDTSALDITENESIRKVGNMGVQTVDDMLEKHVNVWSLFDFYKLIFSEIARDLLRGC